MNMFWKSKVNNFYFRIIRFILKDYILRFNISMNDSLVVQMFNCSKYVLDYSSSISFGEFLLIDNSIKEFSTRAILSHKMEILWILIGFNQSNDVWMIDLPENTDFLFNHDNFIIWDLVSMQAFDCIPWFWIWDFRS